MFVFKAENEEANEYIGKGMVIKMQYEGHTLRHELKYYINNSVYYTLRSRLKTVIGPDPNMKQEDGYLISSIYFDDMYHSAMEEKLAGARFRKKFRIRSYEREDGFIRLECKSKFDDYISKTSASLTRGEYDSIMRGDYDFLLKRKEKVCQELFCYNRVHRLMPVVVVEYLREAYICEAGNIRITFDKDISSSLVTLDMYQPEFATSRVLPEGQMVLEVKYDDYLPQHIQSMLRTAMTNKCAISKYVMCRDKKRMVKYL